MSSRVLAHGVVGAAEVAPATALGWGLACCALLAAATWVGRRAVSRATAAALAFTGGLLTGMVLLDLLPEALHSGEEQGVPRPALLGVAGLAFAGFWLLARSTCSEGSPVGWRGPGSTAAVAGLAVHRVVEGAALGLAATSDVRAAVLLALALVLHGGCEGAVLAVSLASARRAPRTVQRWLVLLCAAPFAGVVWALRVPDPALGAVALAGLSGLLLAAGTGNLHQAAARLSAGRSVSLGAAGLSLLVLATRLPG